MTFRRALPFLVVLAGGGLALHALFSLAGGSIPYQDPPPGLLARQNAELAATRARLWTGGGILLAGLLLAGIQALGARRRRTPRS
jgi:hypothetical protein